MKPDVTVVIPAFNEEKNLPIAATGVVNAISSVTRRYEVLIIDDGSSDHTGAIADTIARADRHIRVIHNGFNRGMGYSLRRGIAEATCTYVTMIPSDNEVNPRLLRTIVTHAHDVDLVIAFMNTSYRRPLFRRIFSLGFIYWMNMMFGLHIRYYNGPFLVKTSLVKRLYIRSTRYTMVAEMYVRLIKAGAHYREVPFDYETRPYGKSKAIAMQTFYETLYMMIRLWVDMIGSHNFHR